MSDNEYKELIDFLGKKFDRIDERFEKMASKEDLENLRLATKSDLEYTRDEITRHMGVLFEAMDHKLDLIVEGMVGANEKSASNKEECDQEIRRLDNLSLINTADIASLNKRVGRLEQGPRR